MNRQSFFMTFFFCIILSSVGALLAQQHQHEKQEAQAGHSHAKAEIHGGEALMTTAHHFEVVWMPDHVMVYLYDQSQKPLTAKGVSGEVVFKFKDGKEAKATLTLMEAGKMMAAHHADGEKHGEQPEMGEKHEMMQGTMTKEEMAAMHKRMSDQDHLTTKVDLGTAKEGEVKATFTLKGLTGKGEDEATFTSKYKMMSMMHHEAGHEQHH